MTEPSKRLYDYQKDCVDQLAHGKKIVVVDVGLGKTPIAISWAKRACAQTGKDKVLVISTPSKIKTNDFENEMDDFLTPSFRKSLSLFDKVSWHSLHKWADAHRKDFGQYVIIADELRRIAGVKTRMARSFLNIVKHNRTWAGFTATPGDEWINFCAYFIATGLVKNKSDFLMKFCNMQSFKGWPEITSYKNIDLLERMWKSVSYAPDTSDIQAQIPDKIRKTVVFKRPAQYIKTLKTKEKADGAMLENASAMAHYLRQLCFTKEKQEWIKDFLTDLGEPCVIFFNYTATADKIEEIAKKALPKGSKVWRIDGTHHAIPTADTIGKTDIVLAQWQSGGEGLNLQFLHVYVAVELTYTYSQFYQSIGRISRIGQEHVMRLYGLIVENSIETAIVKCLQKKQDFAVKEWAVGERIT